MKSKQIQEFKETEIGKIPIDWEVKKMQMLFHIFAGGDLSKISFSKTKSNEYKYPVYSNTIDNKGIYGFSKEYQYEPECVTITARGVNTGRAECRKEPFSAIVRLLVLKPKQKLSCYFITNFINTKLNFPHVGSAQNQLTAPMLSETLAIFPPLDEQEKIGKTLDDLDAKIENLQNQNHTLEQMAQVIFKSWFVNFDGVTEWDDSELGKIPKGWCVMKISDICETFGGGTPSTKNPNYWNGQNHWLVPRDLTSSDRMFCVDSERMITDEGLQNCASQMHPENSIFMTSRATIGAFCINKIPVATNQGFIVSRPKNPNHLYYIFLNFCNRVDEFIQEANGSTFLEISRSNFRQLPVLVPSSEIIENFQTKAKLLFENIFNNEKMIVALTKTRDALLPKLMSGEIRV